MLTSLRPSGLTGALSQGEFIPIYQGAPALQESCDCLSHVTASALQGGSSLQLRGVSCRLLSFSTLPSAAAKPTFSPLASSYRPDSTEVQASLAFGQPDPSALEILWALYRKVKASRWLLGHLSLTDNSLSSDGESRATPAPCLPT